MRIAFVIARVGDDRNVIQKLSLILASALEQSFVQVDIFPFSRKQVLHPFSYRRLENYDCILIANVGLQCAYFSLYKRMGLLKKPFVAISFGSDIRATKSKLINFFNKISRPAINLLIVINPDLLDIARKRGYTNVQYVHSWAEALS